MCIRDRIDGVINNGKKEEPVEKASVLDQLKEKQDGVEFHCFDMDSKVQIAEGHIGWDVLDKQPFSTLEESARMAALQKIPQLAGLTVAPVAPEMLEQMRGGRKVLWQMKKADPELENAKNIRFITSSYEDRFKIPDGSAVEIEYPNRKFSARCEYMDEYHLRLGYDVLHICQPVSYTHLDVYKRQGMMIHCGNPISYASIETSYWRQHYYCCLLYTSPGGG